MRSGRMDESLLLLAGDVRKKTLKILEGVTAEQAHWTPPGLNNHILWHAGHSFIVVEALAAAPLAGTAPDYPPGWFEAFSWKSQPASVKEWPSLSAVVAALQGQITQITTALQSRPAADLSRNIGTDDKPR